MTWRCYPCDINWAPYMTLKGACPKCGAGTVRALSGVSPEALVEHTRMKAAASKARIEDRFEDYYLKREQDRDAALPVTEQIDTLEATGALPTHDPEAEST